MDFLVATKVGGFLGPFAQILGLIMEAIFRFTSMFGVMNIGICIILFTLIVKVVMFPLTVKQQKFSKMNAVMQPELQAIQKKYKGKSDQESMMKMNVETKAVYEKYGVSMTGGCLQLVIQLPILLALYQVIYHIPAYVSSVGNVFYSITDSLLGTVGGNLQTLVEQLSEFATAHSVSMSMISNFTTEPTTSKVVDFLYKLNPAQWQLLQDQYQVISESSIELIERMNSFLGINLATTPWQGFTPNPGWLLPILAGLSQWYSTRLMSSNQNLDDENNPSASMMKQMNIMMPLMSVFFCFTLPSGIGIYWIAQSVFTILQQWIINRHLSSIDIDEMVKKNVEKANAKRAKKGLPPQKISNNATVSLKQLQAEEERKEKELEAKKARTAEQVKESTEYYNKDPKPGSLAAKAAMVKKYNEKHNK